jgi:GPH family glycoside/pentoside/hexuronide:cation symporter/glucuronide carrier protein
MTIGNRVSFGEKISFGLVNLGNIPVQALLGSFLMIFYTDVVGLKPAAIATLFLVARIVDGINDPLMGFIIDHLPRTKMGRFRSYLLFGSVICAINFILVWFGPVWAPAGKLVIAYITYLLLGITFDMMDIPLNSMIPCMADSDKDRNVLSSIKGLSYLAGSYLFNIIAPLILASAVSQLSGYYTLIFTGIVIILVFSIIGVLGIRERITPVNEEKYKLKDIIPILTSRPVVITLIVTLISLMGRISSSSVTIYFFTYIMDRRFDVMSQSFIFSFLGTIPIMLIMPFLAGRIGKKQAYMIGIAVAGMFPLIRLFSVTNIPLYFAATLLAGIGSGLTTSVGYGIQADNVDYIEYTRKQRTESAIAAIQSFVVKAAQGIGGAIPGYILAASGYVPNQPQTDAAKTGIIACIIIIPACLGLISLFLFGFGYNLKKEKVIEIAESLRKERALKT